MAVGGCTAARSEEVKGVKGDLSPKWLTVLPRLGWCLHDSLSLGEHFWTWGLAGV
jgi:hypothetical protein